MEKAYLKVFEESWKKLEKIVKSGKLKNEVKIKNDKIGLIYFNSHIEIDLNNKKFTLDVEDKEKILILHYICENPRVNTFDNTLISFKNIPEGNFYFFLSIQEFIYL